MPRVEPAYNEAQGIQTGPAAKKPIKNGTRLIFIQKLSFFSSSINIMNQIAFSNLIHSSILLIEK